MSVFKLGTSATDKLFLEFIKPGLHMELYNNTTLYDRFKTAKDTCLGKYGIMKLITGTPKSARPSSSSSFPTARQGVYDEFLFYMKRGMYASLQFDGLALATAKGKGAVMDILKAEVDGIVFYIGDRMNKQMWGDGSGRLAQLSAASSNSTTVTIDGHQFGQDSNDYTNPAQYLQEGQYVDIYDTSGTLEVSGIKIVTIVDNGNGTATLTMESAVTASNNSYIFDEDTYATAEAAGTGVPMGLEGIISTSNGTVGITATSAFQNINRSTNGFAQAQSFSMGSEPVTNKMILKVVQKLERYGRIDVIITNDVIYRNYYAKLEVDKTMPNTPAYWGGLTGVTFYGGRSKEIPVIWDEDCPDNKMKFLDSSRIKISAPDMAGMEWLPGDSGRILTRVQGKDEYAAHLRWYYNMTTNLPKSSGELTAVKHAES